MSTQYKTANGDGHARTERRYWTRTDSPRPWHPWGTMQLVWIALLFLIGAVLVAPGIEADVRDQVGDRLSAAGIASAATTADGQSVSIQADATETTEMAVQAIAASTRCQTWAGQLSCPTTVDVKLDVPISHTLALPARPHNFTAIRSGNDVTLSGEVPNIAEQDRILTAAGQYFDGVANEMVITNEAASAHYIGATNNAIAAIGHLQQGQAEWDQQSLSVIGFADAAGAKKSREYFDAAGGNLAQGVFNVSAPSSPDGCNEKFTKVLANGSIQFQTNSATINGSEQLLEDLSRVANSCPGQLLIEGHTDARGDAEMNKLLSQARAESVRTALADLGVEPDRLASIGYGEQQPIADNGTAEGRAANRRISIRTQSNN